MRKIVVLVLALALLLGACGIVEPVQDAAETTTATTQIITTTEIETTTEVSIPLELRYGEINGVAWRGINLEDEENTEVLTWLEELDHIRWQRELEVELTPGRTLVVGNNIYLRNDATGEMTLLVENVMIDGEWTWQEIRKVIDNRFFWFAQNRFGIVAGNVFDTQNMTIIPLAQPEDIQVGFFDERNGVYYFTTGPCDMYPSGQLHGLTLDFNEHNLVASVNISTSEDLLAGIAEATAGDGAFFMEALSTNAHYYAAMHSHGLRIFNLETREFISEISTENIGYRFEMEFMDDNTLILFTSNWISNPEGGNPIGRTFYPHAMIITLP